MADDGILLDAQGISAGYGLSRVLFDVDLQVPRVGGVTILGRNGAGKTTLLKTLVGELPFQGGSVELAGLPLSGLRTHERIKSGIGYVPQEGGVFAGLSVQENLELGIARQRRHGDIALAFAWFPKLQQRLKQTAGTLSGGERKMLAIARALLGAPRILLLDEPTEGMWFGVIDEIAEQLVQLASRIAVVTVEQNLGLAWKISDHVHVLDRGRIVLSGPTSQVREDPRLLQLLAP
ncbi:ABC transporter family protein [Paraburkholderia xenovorans LB400]|uniref:Amino acid/amide ABC transporter ATP-binding protein 2, HAAT family n=1 Tax=Paraburkholderia xenovorans (strain LB400) TaxID=266265 RepID=Q13FM7_PARXL|nr:ABC transporter ATP-binding protein [Paraburkholderia xenovorans]ABE37112.1 amino acid/amide ABC transporter ATP-binding protein 2, HAAT family [Paraburkholderia xenovorans LB400]AIP34821.1 ABC transporter family protein [Paraburkholderia xenovorans LB400]